MLAHVPILLIHFLSMCVALLIIVIVLPPPPLSSHRPQLLACLSFAPFPGGDQAAHGSAEERLEG
eukprot:4913955-Pyramimonas_sp.AAC.1